MGTNYRIQITMQPRNKSADYQEQRLTAAGIFRRHCAADAFVFDFGGKPVSVGKWDWSKCMQDVCAATTGMVFPVMVVSDDGFVSFEYYASGDGFLYADTPTPNFSETRARSVIRARAQKQKETAKAEAAAKALRETAIRKLSTEERTALGLTIT